MNSNSQDEMTLFLEAEKEKAKNNRIKNRPILLMSYVMTLVFLSMIVYMVYYIMTNTETIVADTTNQRQETFTEVVKRGDIITSDGEVVATTLEDDEGNEYRYYPYGGLFAHTVGYNDYGRSGVELDYNFELIRSHVGVAEKIKDDMGNEKSDGDSVVLTLDSRLQSAAQTAFGDAKGAAVVIDVETGDILAMYSNPTFDPNDMDAVWEQVQSEDAAGDAILLNRATQGLYAPGSTFKVITTLEFMRENPDYESYSYYCGGSEIFNSVSIRCSNSYAHGTVDLQGSLSHSCNTSFSNIGCNYIDSGKLRSLADDLLFNNELPYDGEYSKSVFKLDENSNSYDIPQTVIGQGDTLITPLHNALIMQSIANGGVMMKPKIVDKVVNVDGKPVQRYKNESYGKVLEPDEVRTIIPMLQSVCTEGTAASNMGSKPYTVAGKTGTAEYDDNGNCNSWFVGFSNVDDPDIVVSVIVEDYTSNQTSGTYVASCIMDAYYGNTSE